MFDAENSIATRLAHEGGTALAVSGFIAVGTELAFTLFYESFEVSLGATGIAEAPRTHLLIFVVNLIQWERLLVHCND